jgi:hypothetical protein
MSVVDTERLSALHWTYPLPKKIFSTLSSILASVASSAGDTDGAGVAHGSARED